MIEGGMFRRFMTQVNHIFSADFRSSVTGSNAKGMTSAGKPKDSGGMLRGV
jgi:hypothetical protein